MNNKFYNYLYDYMVKEGFISEKNPKNQKEKMNYAKEYLEKLSRVQNKSKLSNSNILRNMYLDKYTISKEEIPESYYKSQEQMYLDRGYGHHTITENEKDKLADIVIDDQKKSLEKIIDYFFSDDAIYPEHLKFWAFQGIMSLGSYDKETGEFKRRNKHTVAPYPEINIEALSLAITNMDKFLQNENIEEKDFIKTIFNSSITNTFEKLYTFYLNKVNSENKSKIDTNEGIWIKYDQGSDHMKLVKTLEGKGTGWCTAGESTAKMQLSKGDFYVYYTKGTTGEYTEPRIAIRMEGNNIGEIRGVASNQNLENGFEDILEEKLKEFPDRDKYKKKNQDMNMLTNIYNKINKDPNVELSKEELRFIYEIDYQITGFGFQIDPRIEEIKSKRKSKRTVKKDLSIVFECKKNEIGFNENDLKNNQLVAYFGDIKYSESKVGPEFSKLRYISRCAYFSSLTTAEGLENLQTIGGGAHFSSLTTAEGLKNLKTIGLSADFRSLTSAQGLENLQTIGGSADFRSLTSAQGLENLQTIEESANFFSLTSAKELENLQTIGCDANFYSLASAKGLEKLQTIRRNASFHSLTSAKGLENLQTIVGSANFRSLTSAEGLENLQTIRGSANFHSLTSAKGLENLRAIHDDSDFSSLTSAQGLENLQKIGSNANFHSLTSAKGLENLQKIVGRADFRSLTSAKGLENLQEIGFSADFRSLTSAEGLENLQIIGWSTDFRSLTSAKGLKNLRAIHGDSDFSSLTNAEDLEKIQTIGADIYSKLIAEVRKFNKHKSV